MQTQVCIYMYTCVYVYENMCVCIYVYTQSFTEPSKKERAPFCLSEEEGSVYIQPDWSVSNSIWG